MLLGDHKNLKKPHPWDVSLILAYETIEAEKCPKCAVPIWYAYSEDNSIAFKHEHVDCWSCAFDEVESKKTKDTQPGRTLFVTAVPEEGFDNLPTRADFQKEMLKKHSKPKE